MQQNVIRPSRAPQRKRQQGFTLIELVIVIAIAAAILFAVWIGVSRAQNSRKANEAVQNFNMMMADVRTKFGVQGSFAGITPAVMIDLGMVPQPMINGNAIRTSFNTAVAVAATNLNGTAGDGVEFSYTIPRVNCADFVTGTSGASARVTVDGTVVKNIPAGDNTLDVAAMSGQCNADAGGNLVVLLAQGR